MLVDAKPQMAEMALQTIVQVRTLLPSLKTYNPRNIIMQQYTTVQQLIEMLQKLDLTDQLLIMTGVDQISFQPLGMVTFPLEILTQNSVA